MKYLLLATVLLFISSCCSGAHCPERASGGDWPRTKGVWVKKFGTVINDKVSWPKLDRTDWRYVVLPGAGKLTVQLHWDNGKAVLELAVWDEMGIKIQDGRVWGELGLKSVVAVENPGRYYIEVRAKDEDSESPYSLRLFYEPEQPVAKCDPCENLGETKCLGTDGFQTCVKQSPKCIGWSETTRCPDETECENGACVKIKVISSPGKEPPPPRNCKAGARACKGDSSYVVCEGKGKNTSWSTKVTSCPANQACRRGKCEEKAAPPPPKGQCVEGKIISMYIYQGKPTLHIEMPSGHGITPDSSGVVYSGTTKKALKDGAFTVRKVSGNYCVATTDLKTLGQNRKVCITPK